MSDADPELEAAVEAAQRLVDGLTAELAQRVRSLDLARERIAAAQAALMRVKGELAAEVEAESKLRDELAAVRRATELVTRK